MLTPIPVVRLAPGDQWDQTLLDDLISGALWPHGLEFERLDAYPDAPGIVLLVPGRYWAHDTVAVADAIARYDWVLAIRASDEEDLFDITKVVHPNIKWWAQSPRLTREYPDARLIPLGFTPHFTGLAESPDRRVDVFLSAQETHARRVQCFTALSNDNHTQNVYATAGFTQGLTPAEYAQAMCDARVAPAPAGPVSAETFRLYEALQAHTIPIADDYSPADGRAGYWQRMFPDAPFPLLTDYNSLPGYIDDALTDYPRLANRVTAWWIAQKRAMAWNLRADLRWLGAL